jgi:hypothetical protein
VETGADLDEGAHAAFDIQDAGRLLGHVAQDFQQRTLSGTIWSDQADGFTLLDAEVNILQGPKFFLLGNRFSGKAADGPAQAVSDSLVQVVALS